MTDEKMGLFKTLLSIVQQRASLLGKIGTQQNGARDLYKVFGYPQTLTPTLILGKYARQDITSRVIDAPPQSTWQNPLKITVDGKENAEAQKAWDALDTKYQLRVAMQRVDTLARLFPFAALVVQFDRMGKLNAPLNFGTTKHDLLYIRPVSFTSIGDVSFDTDESSATFGRPKVYKMEFSAANSATATSITNTAQQTPANGAVPSRSVVGQMAVDVDASRVIHVVEKPLDNDLFGNPIIERIYNTLDDLLKVCGGTAETFWKIGNRGLHANVDKGMSLSPEDQAALEEMFEEYDNDLRRIIQTRGVDVKALGADVPNTQNIFDILISVLSATSGIPKRILLGSEAGQLASEQDRANWAERIEERRNLYCTPRIALPLLRLLQQASLLPQGELGVIWPPAFTLSPLENSMVMAQTARAIGNIARHVGNNVPMQLVGEEEARTIIGLKGRIPDGQRIAIPKPTSSVPTQGPTDKKQATPQEAPTTQPDAAQ